MVVKHSSRPRALHPDVILMDVRMPEMDGVAATRELGVRFPEVKVIILTTFEDDETVFEGLKAGARGYLLKDISSEEMAEAVRKVAAGEALIQSRITRKVLAEFSRLAIGNRPAATFQNWSWFRCLTRSAHRA